MVAEKGSKSGAEVVHGDLPAERFRSFSSGLYEGLESEFHKGLGFKDRGYSAVLGSYLVSGFRVLCSFLRF